MVVLGGGAVSYERGTSVVDRVAPLPIADETSLIVCFQPEDGSSQGENLALTGLLCSQPLVSGQRPHTRPCAPALQGYLAHKNPPPPRTLQ